MTPNAIARRLAALVGAGIVLATGTVLSAPAAQAYTPMQPTITSPGYDTGNALTVGAQYFLAPVDAAAGVNVGGTLTGAMGALDYGLAAPVNFKPNWYSCPSRAAAIDRCTLAQEGQQYVGTAANRSFTYTAKAGDIGRFMRYSVLVRASTLGIEGSSTEYSDPAKDILVLPGASRTTAPTWSPAVAGASTTLQLNAWTPGTELSFANRTLTVYRCSAADAGQVTTTAWSTAGCTTLANAVRTTVSGAGATTVTVDVPADAAGSYLLAQDLATFRTAGGYTSVTVVRSGTVAVSATATPAPTASPTPTPSASAAATPAPTSVIPVNPSAPARESAVATAKGMNLAITARSAVTRGSNFRVTLNLSSPLRGKASMAIKKQPTARAKSLQTLKVVTVDKGTGTRVNRMARLPKGKYYLVASYRDDISGVKRLVTRPITVK